MALSPHEGQQLGAPLVEQTLLAAPGAPTALQPRGEVQKEPGEVPAETPQAGATMGPHQSYP